MNEEIDIEELAPWLVAVITLVGGWLRIYLLGMKGIWLDEAFSVWVSSQSVADMLHWLVRIDQHPPLYYLLLHYWIAFNGDAPSSVRMLSVLFGAGTIPIIYLIGKRISGATMGLAAAVILALSTFNIAYAQETRMYTLLTFNAAVAIYALVRLLTDPRAVQSSASAGPIGSQFREYLQALRSTGHRWLPIRTIETDLAWLAFIVFSAATLLSHNTAVFFPLATNIFVLGLMLYQRKMKSETLPAFQAPSLGNWVKAQIGIFLLWSPWLLAFIQQASRVYQEFWIPAPTWETVIQTLASFLNGYMPRQAGQLMFIWILYGLVFGVGLLHFRKRFSQFLFLAALFAVPFLGELIVSIRRPIFFDRTLIWTTIPLFLLLAAGIAQIRFRLPIIVVLGILGTNSMFSSADYFRYFQKEDWSDPAGYVANFVQKDDLILFHASWMQIPFDYYFRVYEKQYNLQVEKHGIPVDMFDRGILEPKMTEADIPGLISMVSGRKRVWLVYSHNWYTDPEGLVPQTLASVMKLVQTREYYGVQVQLYEAP
jgi:mannosyltransferase